MKKLRPLLFLLIFAGACYLVHARLLGMAGEPFLEKVMTRVFDMPVHIDGMCIFPFEGRVTIAELQILNPPGFTRRDHFTCKEIDVTIDLGVLKNKFIRIQKARIKKVIFAIESYMTQEGSRTNVWHWYHNMGLDEESPPIPPRPPPNPDNIGEKFWRTRINRLDIEDGMIIFDDRREEEPHRWIFEHIKGYWTGFDFLSDYVSPTFTETIQVESTFGENPPAQFKGGGRCQFADGDNFDVDIAITGGSMAEYGFLWDPIFGEVQSGTFDLKSHLLCVEGDLRSEHALTLKSMKIATPTATQKLLKYPFGAIRALMENQKTVEMEIKVDGDISDPKFRMFSGFTNALQKAMVEKTKAGLMGTVKIAVSTPGHVKEGLSKIGAFLVEPFTSKNKNSAAPAGEEQNV